MTGSVLEALADQAASYCNGLWAAFGLYWLVMARRVARTEVSEGIASRLSHLVPVFVGFCLLLQRPLDAYPVLGMSIWPETPVAAWFGLVVTAAGLAFAVWARLHLGRYWSGTITLKEGHRLIRTGPYAFARHPIYTGILAAVCGTAGVIDRWRCVAALVVLAAAFLAKSRREERTLTSRFGDEYSRYQQEVKALVPFVF